jgi:hypothetical protein
MARRHTEIIREYPSMEGFFENDKEIRTGSDRAAAILVGASVEWALEAATLAQFPCLDDETLEKLRGGALSSFYGNIYLAYAMGIIDSAMRDDLNTIRKVRNIFAHAMTHVTFSRPEISAECNKLVSGYAEAVATRKPFEEVSGPEQRRRYVEVAHHLSLKLLETALKKYKLGDQHDIRYGEFGKE